MLTRPRHRLRSVLIDFLWHACPQTQTDRQGPRKILFGNAETPHPTAVAALPGTLGALSGEEISEVGTEPETNVEQRTQTAVTQCEEQIRWFATHSRADWWLYRTFQLAVVILSGSSPVLILFTDLPKPLQALPAAVAALAGAVAASFHWHEDAVRWGATRELLRSELRQFRVRGGEYSVKVPRVDAFDTFVTRVEAIIAGELTNWRSAEQGPSDVSKR